MKQGSCCVVCKLATLLAGVGALNWGLLALFQLDLVASALGGMTTAAKAVYVVIGVAGVVKLMSLFVKCPCCKPDGAACSK